MKIHSRRKYIIYLAGIIMMIAVAVAATSDSLHNGKIIFSADQRAEKEVSDETVISDEDGIIIIADGEMLVKYEKRSEFIVNINTASEEDMIRLLPGIGSKRAAAIVEYRELAGGFDSVEELCEVEGIGEKIMEDLRPYCTIEGESVQYAGERNIDSEEKN